MTNENTTQEGQTPINTHKRLFDLVRNCRAQLHEEQLITDNEYAWLCQHTFADDPKQGSPSPRRLEDYDDLRKQLAAQAETIAGLTEAYRTKTHQADELQLDLVRALAQLTEARRDGERLEWLDSQCSAYGFEGVHEGNNWQIGGPFSNIRQAIDAAVHRNAGEGRG